MKEWMALWPGDCSVGKRVECAFALRIALYNKSKVYGFRANMMVV
jgi:hypothetical protein